MDGSAAIIALSVFAVLVVLAVLAWLSQQDRMFPRRREPPAAPGKGEHREVVLDVPARDADDPAVERLVTRTAEGIFRHAPEAREVVVKSRDGTVLGTRRRRPEPLPKTTDPQPPPVKHRGHEPSPVAQTDHQLPPVGDAPDEPSRPVAELFDLPEEVHAELRDPDDHVELVRAILASAGRPAERIDHDLIRSGDELVAVIGHRGGRPGMTKVLNDVYLQFQRSGARSGLVISLAYVDPAEIRRREILAPELTHEGPDAIQRMADAVSFGADPIEFAGGPTPPT